MEEIFVEFCRYYILEEPEENLKHLQEKYPKNFKEYQKKAIKFSKNLKRKTKKLGYNTDFESFCNMLEDYITKKDNMTDDEKKSELKILMSLSKIHDINLREELERYVSYKQTVATEITPAYIFKKFCRYNLDLNNSVEEFNELKKLAEANSLDFNDLQQTSKVYVEEIKSLTEKLGFTTTEESLYEMIEDYMSKKKFMSDNQKATYLRILLYLSEIYNINLRELLTKEKNIEPKVEKLNTHSILKNVNNPLDDYNLLNNLIDQRYNNGSFEVENIPNNDNSTEEEYDYNEIQAKLTYRIYQIFLDKFNNYAFDDLNSRYTHLIAEEDINILESLTEEDIYNILNELDKNETKHYICKKYKLTENLYNFILLSTKEATNLKANYLYNKYSLFNLSCLSPTISIYLQGEEKAIFELLSNYIIKCIQNNISYEIKNDNNSNNIFILYANNEDIEMKLDILNNLMPKYKNKLFNPNPICAKVNNSYYGISDIGLIRNNECILPYFDYINLISEVAYYRVLSKIVVEKITDEKAKYIVNNFIALNYLKVTPSLKIECNNISLETIKDLINQYIPLVSNTIIIYMSKQDEREKLIEEFKKSLKYVSNILNGIDKKATSNLALNNLNSIFNNF